MKYPYNLYEKVFERALALDLVDREHRMQRKEWSKLEPFWQDHAMTELEEDIYHATKEPD